MRELYTANLFWLDFSQLWIESAKSSGLHCAVLVFSCDENLYRRRSFTSGLRGATSQDSCCVDRKEASKKVLTSAIEDSFSASFMWQASTKNPWFGFMIKRIFIYIPDYDWLFRSCHESESQLRIPCQFNQARLRNVFWIDGQPFTRILVSRRLIQMAGNEEEKNVFNERKKIWSPMNPLFYGVHISPNAPICRLEKGEGKTFFSGVPKVHYY